MSMISVIVPCFNCERTIRRAIDSVVNQTYDNWELILVNNKSSDGTKAILKEYSSSLGPKVIYVDEYKKGAPAARNCGLFRAKGEWLQFLDADDELILDKFERQIENISVTNSDVLVGSYFYLDNGFNKKSKLCTPLMDNIWKGLISSQLGITSANLYKKDALLAIDGWDETLTSSQEYNLLFSLMKNGATIVGDNVPSCRIYADVDSVSRTSDPSKNYSIIDNFVQTRLRIKEYLKHSGLLTKDIDHFIDVTIYKLLIYRRHLSEDTYRSFLSSLRLNIPWYLVASQNIKYYIKSLFMRSS